MFQKAIHFIRAMLFLLLGTTGWASTASGPVRSEYVEAELISEVEHIQPGKAFWVGLRLAHDPHWHTYWANPGDSGLETVLTWDLPSGFEAGPIHWPYPERIVMEPLVTYGYERDVLLMVEIRPPDQLVGDEPVTLAVRADWLECKEICLPGSAELSVTLPVSDELPQAVPERAELFAQARAEWPIRDHDWALTGLRNDDTYSVEVTAPDYIDHTIDQATFFALDPEQIAYLPPQDWQQTSDGYSFELQRDTTFDNEPDLLRGVLVSDTGWRGPNSEKALYVEIPIRASDRDAVTGGSTDEGVGAGEVTGLGTALLFAFLGGVILNLMPCVFPVISIKIMGFVRQAEEGRGEILKHGLLFGLGVLVSFWILAGLLIALRAGGEQLGWGFHLQSPIFLVLMSVLFFLLGLNLFGVFEVGTTWMGIGQKATASSSGAGSFFSGALATVIATPCTAPFMGAALGYALTLSAFEALLIFTFLGLGMAFPYVILSAFPQWLSRVPKPGPWMETLKQSMGWLLVATVVWLIWVLHIMAGGEAVVALVGVLFLVGLGAWIVGRWGSLARSFPVRITAKTIATLLVVGGIAGGITAVQPLEGGAVTSSAADSGARSSGMPWEPFTVERFEALRAEGSPVFVNFTAAWCLSCQVNDRVAFSSERVQEAFRAKGITPLKADWTNRDDTIAEVLAGYGRNSVPFYVLYGDDADAEPITLPEILRPGIVLDALDQI